MAIEKISIIQELSNLIGMDATTRLCLVFGGTRLHIGSGIVSRQRLGVIVGEELAEKLISHYQGVDLDVPKVGVGHVQRNLRITADAAAGMSHPELSMKYELTERQIRNILSSALPKNDGKYLSLFKQEQ